MEIGEMDEKTERGMFFNRKVWRVCYAKEFVRGHENKDISIVVSFTNQRKAIMFSSILKSLEEIKLFVKRSKRKK